jgi:hypothetical protein
MNRLPTFAVVALAVCLLALATSAVGPVLMGSGALDFSDFFPVILVSLAATVAGFAWLAFTRAVPTHEWLVPLGTVAGWCTVIGLLTLLTNYSGRAHWAEELQDAEERTSQLRGPGLADSKGEVVTPDALRAQLDDAQADVKQALEQRDYKTKGCYLSIAMTMLGLVAGGKLAQLYRQRQRAA